MTVRACAYSPSGLNAAASSGRRRRTGWSRSAPGRWVICSRASTGGCRRKPGDQRRLVDCGMINAVDFAPNAFPAFRDKLAAWMPPIDDIAALRSALEQAQARAAAAEAKRPTPHGPGRARQHRSPDRVTPAGDREAAAGALRPRAPSARRGSSSSSSCSSPNSRRPRPRTRWRPRRPGRQPIAATHVRQRPPGAPLPGASAARAGRRPGAEPAAAAAARLAKIGEVVTETLDVVPRHWFVKQTVREKFTCRDCETITEPPAPFHVIPRGRIGASLLAMILFEKYGHHQPLNRQSERYAREGVDLDCRPWPTRSAPRRPCWRRSTS